MADGDLNGLTLSEGLDRVPRAEIVVGIPSVGAARTIGTLVDEVAAGLARYYPATPCVIVTADASWCAGAAGRAPAGDGATPVLAVHERRLPPSPAAEREAARAILLAAERWGARACALVDGGVGGLAPEWIRLLLEPVVHDGLDLVAPLYGRHRYDGLLTASLLYPLTRALYGLHVRQPEGGHLALSGLLVGRLLRSGLWDRGAGPGALDLWMTTTAIAEGLRVGQAHLGPWRAAPRGAAAELGESFARVVGTAFTLMEEYRPCWWTVVTTAEVPTYGPPQLPGLEPVSINLDRMISTLRQGVIELAPVWSRVLAPDTWATLAELHGEGAPDFVLPAELWARSVYDCAAAFHRRVLPRRHLLRAMIPLYLGCAAAFVLRTEPLDAMGVEAEIEALCRAFEAMKPHLLDRWDDPRP